ncbi:hypothetical protein [Mycolicibacterium tusciae]|uniref:hypothetical protein n=1 Tax=Mycolicibacterium tusciae TaxID=75922 RepID=UPI00024A2A21|nr:hypothetical protein [Mycolicibacterium tusciae]
MATTTNSRPTPGSRHTRSKQNRPRRSLLLVVLIAALAAIGILGGGYVIGRDLASAPSSAQSSAPAPQPPSPATLAPGTPAPVDAALFATEFATLAAELNAQVGIVVRPVGVGPEPVTAGEWFTGTAWSTIKVPLAIAGLRETDPPGVTEAMRAAITQSDNDAAESIWASLGDPATAAAKVQAVLAEAGAPTAVESQRLRPEFTAFGQTTWSLTDQATFLSSAACDPRNQPIMDLMGQIEPDQTWGLGQIPGAKFKGGWGPSPAGDYLVRQFGVVPVNDGLAVVAVAVEPNSGAFDDGTQALTRIATWLTEHADLLPVGNCA